MIASLLNRVRETAGTASVNTSPDVRSLYRGRLVFVVLVFIASCVLSYELFHPSVANVWNFDEAYYINNGRLLLQGTVPKLAENPLVAFFWAVVSTPFLSSSFWMIYASSLGRILLYALLWFGAYTASKAFSDKGIPYLTIGLLLVTPTLAGLLENSSDALYAALSALTFGSIVRAYREGAVGYLRLASVVVTLAALCRNDGFVLFVIVLLSSVVLLRRRMPFRTILLSLGVPFAIGFGGYIVFSATIQGDLDLGLARRTYDAFEQGQGVVYHEQYRDRNPYTEGYVEARRLYGTPEENDFSIFQAIRRNPDAFFQRLVHAVTQIPAQATTAYGRGLRGLGVILLLLAMRGLVHLWAKREHGLLFLLFMWTGSLAPYTITFFREGYFLLLFFLVLALGSLGISELAGRYRDRNERTGWSAALVVVVFYGLVVGNESIVWPVFVFFALLWAVWVFIDRGAPSIHHLAGRLAPSLLVLLILSAETQLAKSISVTAPGWLPRPPPLKIGMSPAEQAALYLAATLPEGSNVASYSPAPVYLAKMTWFPLHSGIRTLQSAEDVAAWIQWWKIDAIYLEDEFVELEPRLHSYLQRLVGTDLAVVFGDERDATLILTRSSLPLSEPEFADDF